MPWAQRPEAATARSGRFFPAVCLSPSACSATLHFVCSLPRGPCQRVPGPASCSWQQPHPPRRNTPSGQEGLPVLPGQPQLNLWLFGVFYLPSPNRQTSIPAPATFTALHCLVVAAACLLNPDFPIFGLLLQCAVCSGAGSALQQRWDKVTRDLFAQGCCRAVLLRLRLLAPCF